MAKPANQEEAIKVLAEHSEFIASALDAAIENAASGEETTDGVAVLDAKYDAIADAFEVLGIVI